MTKRKVEAPDRPEDCVSIAQKVAFSLMVREKFEALANDPWSAPSDLGVLMDRYPHDPAMPWTHRMGGGMGAQRKIETRDRAAGARCRMTIGRRGSHLALIWNASPNNAKPAANRRPKIFAATIIGSNASTTKH
jgi:hypothetical protein